MTTNEETKLTMYNNLISLMRKNNSVTFNMPAFGNSLTEFTGLVEQIKDKNMELSHTVTGKTPGKFSAEDELIDALSPIIAALYIYARKYNDTILKENVRITETELEKLGDTGLINKAQSILKWANENIDSLADNGISIEDLNTLRKKIDTFKTLCATQDPVVKKVSSIRTALHSLFEEADSIIQEDMDNFVEIIKPNNPQFYKEYLTTRNVLNPIINKQAAD